MPKSMRSVAPGSTVRSVLAGMLAAALLLAGGPAAAQDSRSPISELRRLAEIMGGAHYLRITCAGRTDQTWRRMMVEFLDAEAPAEGARRAELVRAFNTGYTREERSYPFCDDSVRNREARLAGEGRTLAETLRDRYLE